MNFDELNALSTKDLHDRAVDRAQKHFDVRFFWDLLKTIPAAEAAAGNLDEASEDILRMREAVNDAFHADEGNLGEALRPFYIDYLQRHQDG